MIITIFPGLIKIRKYLFYKIEDILKTNKLNISAGAGVTTSGAFVDSFNVAGRLSFFFTESMGVEFLYSKNSGKENDTAEASETLGGQVQLHSEELLTNIMEGIFRGLHFTPK